MPVTVESHEMNAIANLMIANNHYTILGLRELVNSYNNPALSLALDCVMEDGTIDIIIEFFISNPHFYPEAQLVNNTPNRHVLLRQALMCVAVDDSDLNHLVN